MVTLELTVAEPEELLKKGWVDDLPGLLNTAVPKVDTEESSATGTKVMGTGEVRGVKELEAAGGASSFSKNDEST